MYVYREYSASPEGISMQWLHIVLNIALYCNACN